MPPSEEGDRSSLSWFRLLPSERQLIRKEFACLILSWAVYIYFYITHNPIWDYLATLPLALSFVYLLVRALSRGHGNVLTEWLRNRLPGIRLPLAQVMGAYLLAILWFGGLYTTIYRNYQTSFLFSSGVANAQVARYLERSASTLSDLEAAKTAMESLKAQLKDSSARPKRDEESRAFSVPSATVHFWVYGPADDPLPMGWAASVEDGHERTLWSYQIHPFDSGGDVSFRGLAMEASEHLQRSIDGLLAVINTRAQNATDIWSYWDFVYFSGITLSTVGYGDILPNTTGVRMVVLFEILFGVFLLVWVVNIVASTASQSGVTRAPADKIPE